MHLSTKVNGNKLFVDMRVDVGDLLQDTVLFFPTQLKLFKNYLQITNSIPKIPNDIANAFRQQQNVNTSVQSICKLLALILFIISQFTIVPQRVKNLIRSGTYKHASKSSFNFQMSALIIKSYNIQLVTKIDTCTEIDDKAYFKHKLLSMRMYMPKHHKIPNHGINEH